MEKQKDQSETGFKTTNTSISQEQIVFGQKKKVEYVSFRHGSNLESRQRTFNKTWGKK